MKVCQNRLLSDKIAKYPPAQRKPFSHAYPNSWCRRTPCHFPRRVSQIEENFSPEKQKMLRFFSSNGNHEFSNSLCERPLCLWVYLVTMKFASTKKKLGIRRSTHQQAHGQAGDCATDGSREGWWKWDRSGLENAQRHSDDHKITFKHLA